jgi:hypothetical protein
MESLEHAQARGANIICEYLGGATNCDAYHMTVRPLSAYQPSLVIHCITYSRSECRRVRTQQEVRMASDWQAAEPFGSCSTQDPRADGLGVSGCIELALKDAKIDRDQVWQCAVSKTCSVTPQCCVSTTRHVHQTQDAVQVPACSCRSTTSTLTRPAHLWAMWQRSRLSSRHAAEVSCLHA